MPANMTAEQLSFWRELLAPFRPDELSVKKISGRDFIYIDKRSLANRLDTVIGPDGWYPEYRDEGGRGLVCRLYLRVPTGNGTYVFMHKEEGGADEGMTKKDGGDKVEDVDNNFKSEFTNSFRRAAQDAWGIGRYLYEKGIPGFLDPNARPGQAAPQAAPAPVQSHAQPAQPAPAAEAPQQRSGGFDNYRIPSPRAMFPWVKEMETVFETRILNGINADSESLGFPKVFAQCNEDQIKVLATNAISYIKTLPTYKGQFDHIDTSVDHSPNAANPPTVDNIAKPDLGYMRKQLMSLMQEHVLKSIGREADSTELKAAFGQIASHCPNGAGNMGEIPASLAGLNDVIWLENMIAFVTDQIRNTVPPQTGEAASSDIPF